jgi:hypothetical protein
MSFIQHSFGGASISVKILPISTTTPVNPRVSSDIATFLSLAEKASFLGADESFSRCLASFVEEFDIYLDDRRLSKDDDIVGEMEEFMNQHLSPEVRRNLKKLGEEK